MRWFRSFCLIGVALLGVAWTAGAAAAAPTSSRVTLATVPLQPTPPVVATPKGWVPVAYGRAQLSVPATWYVFYSAPPCLFGHPPGEIFVNPTPGVFNCPAELPPRPATVVELGPIRVQPGPIQPLVLLNINGIVVVPVGGGTYLVPSLGVQITISGPLGFRVLETLERSPRDIALASGPVPAVPPSWTTISFAGVSVAVPATWPVSNTDVYGPNCSPLQPVEFLGKPSVVLDTDEKLLLLPCPYQLYERPYRPSNGLRIDEVTVYPPVSQSEFHWCLPINGLTVCPAQSPAYSILILRVTGPTLSKPVYVSIGLGGRGLVARTVLYSLAPAPATS